jgi:hypothetical protein
MILSHPSWVQCDIGVMMGLRMYSFIDVMIVCLNYVRSVSLNGAAFNPSWHLTAVGAVSSAVAGVKPRGATSLYGVHAASRRWLSFFRSPALGGLHLIQF